jgi:hypothetical protein
MPDKGSRIKVRVLTEKLEFIPDNHILTGSRLWRPTFEESLRRVILIGSRLWRPTFEESLRRVILTQQVQTSVGTDILQRHILSP